ncbi:YeeE/YedE thiosulfate transporter family protein [Candidatus Magnetominusculus xianensis]|uniref:YeeE/YedE family protein n=1 Tax=Candidatus Magnetominusculus xianensis TaxID=1748249 RepID=A0ABR5SEH5_9BACT|nr:YeeE/YedE thiosulfate transporter family protein [Candidatus Magnetominusculus xianensis]KWT84411.1 YeeE/YedE family protein [Candidatus Magnetominusculus xianensis]MBF0404245.1 YeeE/YedE family protein [Nitrospirota bacterium]
MDGILMRLKDTFDPSTIEAVRGPASLYGGLIVGFLLGIVLQKGRLGKFDIVSGMFRMQDFTFWRVGTPLLMFGMVLIYFFKDIGVVELYLPRTVVLAQLFGGVLFGAGLAIAGYCPAIAACALGEGALDAFVAMAGIVFGSILYAEMYDGTQLDKIVSFIDLGRVTFPEIFLVFNHWFFIMGFVFMCAMFLLGISMYDEFLKASFSLIDKVGEKLSGSKVERRKQPR